MEHAAYEMLGGELSAFMESRRAEHELLSTLIGHCSSTIYLHRPNTNAACITFFPRVTILSAVFLNSLAFDKVVCILSCSMSCVTIVLHAVGAMGAQSGMRTQHAGLLQS